MVKLKETIFFAKRCRVLRLIREDDKMFFFKILNLVFLFGGIRKDWRKESYRKFKK